MHIQKKDSERDRELLKSPSPESLAKRKDLQDRQGIHPENRKALLLQQVILFPENCLQANPSPSSSSPKQNARRGQLLPTKQNPLPHPFIPFHLPRRKLECTNEESEGMELSTSLWLPIDSVSMATDHVSEPFAAPPPRCTRPPSRRKGFWVA